MITSRQNLRLKDIRRARQCKDDVTALLEGPHLVGEAAAAGVVFQTLVATAEFLASPAGRDLAPRLPLRPLLIDADLLAEVTDSDSPRGIVAVAQLPRSGVDALPRRPDGIYVFADGIQDPGNLGALARVAE